MSGLQNERLAIGERAPCRCLEKVLGIHARKRLQGAEQFVAFPIFTAETDRKNLSDTERHEVVENRARSSRLRANARDVVNRQARFDGVLRASGIDLQISIEAAIANHSDAQPGIAAGDFLKTFRSHAFS